MHRRISSMFHHRLTVLSTALTICTLSLLSVGANAQTWDLANDFSTTNGNPNGAWTYGYNAGSGFTAFDSVNSGAWVYSGAGYGGAFIYKNLANYLAYGIYPGEVSLEADNGTPEVRWTAPTSGVYTINVAIGGTTANSGGGFGNNDASGSGLLVGGVAQTGSYSNSTNVYSWSITNIVLTGGTHVDAYVNHGYGGGNTQTIFTVTQNAVPEPNPVLIAGVALVTVSLALRRRNAAVGNA